MLACAACTAYTVYVRLRVLREVEVDHVSEVIHIYTTRCYVCSYEDIDLPHLKFFEDQLTL